MENKLYSYTSLTEILASFSAKPGWIRIKQGLTIKQEESIRVHQQDNAATTADLIILSTLTVPDNNDSKLDDKVRKYQHTTDNFQKYKRFNNVSKKHEWSYVYIDDILQSLGKIDIHKKLTDNIINKNTGNEELIQTELLNNKQFMNILSERIAKSKEEAIDKLLNKKIFKTISLRPWQTEVVNEMISANKKYNLLSLAPRFGKTFAILEYMKILSKDEKLVLIPVSKNLSSNSSFIKDYNNGGYNTFDIIHDASLFKDDEKIMENLRKEIPAGYRVVLVTDEADLASHTEISQNKLKQILEEFDVFKQIAMSGTGVYKAAKIFSNIRADDIFFKSINYSELFEFSGLYSDQIVKRNFFNIFYDMESIDKKGEVMNIRQSFKYSSAHKNLSKFIRLYTGDIEESKIINELNIKDSSAIMVFANAPTLQDLRKLVKEYNKQFPEHDTLLITGKETTNAKAEELTKTRIRENLQNKDYRPLIIFSNGMASRSYSIPEIRRVIVLSDGLLTPTFVQSSSRCLTYDTFKQGSQGSQSADIIRISTERYNLASEVFLSESEVTGYDDLTITKAKKFLTNNTFTDFNGETIEVYSDNEAGAEYLIDAALKHQDSTKYILSKIYGEDIEVDVSAIKSLKSKTRTLNDKVNGKKKSRIITTSEKTPKEDELALEHYVNIVRTLPYIVIKPNGDNITSVKDLLDYWWDGIVIDRDIFIINLQNEILF